MSTAPSVGPGDIALGLFVFLFVGAMARGQAIYWLARVVTDRVMATGEPGPGWRLRVHRWLHSDGVARARRSLARWGWPLVPVAYLTVGLQSMVMAAAGMVRMPALRYALAQVPGALAWAVIYSTVGFAFWGAFFAALGGDPVWLVLLLAGLLVVVVGVRSLRRGGPDAAGAARGPGRPVRPGRAQPRRAPGRGSRSPR